MAFGRYGCLGDGTVGRAGSRVQPRRKGQRDARINGYVLGHVPQLQTVEFRRDVTRLDVPYCPAGAAAVAVCASISCTPASARMCCVLASRSAYSGRVTEMVDRVKAREVRLLKAASRLFARFWFRQNQCSGHFRIVVEETQQCTGSAWVE